MSNINKKFHFIYVTTNLINGKIYVGKHSTNNIDDRYFGSNKELKKDISINLELNFKRDILEFCEFNSLEDREVFWISKLNSIENGYNKIVSGGGGDTCSGFTMSQERKDKISNSSTGKKMSPNAINNMKLYHKDVSGEENPMYGVRRFGEENPMFNKKHKKESIDKMSETKKEMYRTSVHPMVGFLHSEETN